MITPRLSVLMVAMSVLGAGSPLAAMAQASTDNTAEQVIAIGSGSTTEQSNSGFIAQEQENNVEIESEAESGDAESEAESEAESGDAKGKYSESEAESEAESGDATSGDATAATTLDNSPITNANVQTATLTQSNTNSDDDVNAVVATNTADNFGIATAVTTGDIVLEGDIGDILALLGLE